MSDMSSESADHNAMRVDNQMSGIANLVVQAGSIYGDVNIYPFNASTTAARTLPADTASFTGRQVELEQIVRALPIWTASGVVGISAVNGMAGVGKTTFAVHAAHRLASRFPDGQLFVRLHGHTPGQNPVNPSEALATLLIWTGAAPDQIPRDIDARAGMWRARMHGRRVLVVLDDAISSEQVRPLLPGTADSLVLITSRRRLSALPDALAVTLDVLPVDEATELFVRLSGCSSPSTDDRVVEVTTLCGFLPLAIALMAGQIKHHPSWTTDDLASNLRSATDRLSSLYSENISVAAAFDLSYCNLDVNKQQFFRRLGLHPGTDFDAYAATALADIDLPLAHRYLDDLFNYHLINEPTRGRYRFHDLIRNHARTLAELDESPKRESAIDRLLNYYLYTARAADHHWMQGIPVGVPEIIDSPPKRYPCFSDRDQAVKWLEAERLNLHSAVDYAAQSDRPNHAIAIPAATLGFLDVHKYWQEALELQHIALGSAQLTGNRLAEANALNGLGVIKNWDSDYQAAAEDFLRALELYRSCNNRHGEANVLTNLGVIQGRTSEYAAAISGLTRALELHRIVNDKIGEANTFNHLGIVQHLTGDDLAAVSSLIRAREQHQAIGNRLREASALHNLGCVYLTTRDHANATMNLELALAMYKEVDNPLGQAHALNDLGCVQIAACNYQGAIDCLSQALEAYYARGNRAGQADARKNLGIVLHLTGNTSAADAALGKALEELRAIDNRLEEASALNDIGTLMASFSSTDACANHERSYAIAIDISSQMEEARALEGIGRCCFRNGHPGRGTVVLRRAIAIYSEIGSANAARAIATLRDQSQPETETASHKSEGIVLQRFSYRGW